MKMKKLRLLATLALIPLLFSMVTGAAAQAYTFNLAREVVNVYWNSDGSQSLDYVFTFVNDPGGHVIDFTDVGMPNAKFDMGSISADVNGNPVNISSDFQGEGQYGFAVDMGAHAIQPGQTGSVHVYVGSIRDVVYKDTETPDTYVSGVLSPAYFTTAYGDTDMTVIFHFPADMQGGEPRYHAVEGGWPCDQVPVQGNDDQNRVTYTWQCSNASGNTQYTFGASFPSQYIPPEAVYTPPAFDLSGLISGILSNLSGVCCFGFFIFLFVGAPILSSINNKNRKLKYLPPKIQIEGHGIKRGLTAVEAGLLMEQPLDKVMTMILFGVVKKNAATVVTRDPLQLQLSDPQPTGLHEYEKDFLAAFATSDQAARRKALSELTIKMVNSLSDKMKGFSRKETIAYYQSIMERAWQQVEAADTPEVKSQNMDQALEWTMLDKNYDERSRRTFTGPVFLPMWWGRYDPGYRPAVGGSKPSLAGSSSGGGAPASLPGSAFAASVVTGVQGFSSRVLGDVKSFTSGVTNKTNPVPVVKSSSRSFGGGGGGGHSCACACACAGCACACAGGGR